MNFSSINKIYENVNQYELHFHRLQHYGLKKFSTALYRLETEIKINELSHELLLNDLISSLRKYRFYICASLISFNEFTNFLEKEKLDQLYNRCCNLFPNIISELENCYFEFNTLVKLEENPMLDYINNNINKNLYTGVLLKSTFDYEATNSLIQSIFVKNNCRLIGSQILKTDTFFDQIIIIGPTRWFPYFIYNSPHAPKVHTITYKWLERKFEEDLYLERSTNKSTIFSGRKIIFNDQLFQKDELEDVILETNIENTLDHKIIEKQLSNITKKTIINEEVVPAKLVVLSNDRGIFFEDVSLKNIFSIYSDPYGFTIGKTSINEIEKNSYILVRTGTKQDLIRAKADEIIGNNSQLYRKIQMRWKNRLRYYVLQNGMNFVQKALLNLGVKNPTEPNIRNWMSEDNIKPALENDFKNILKFINLEEKTDKYIKVAKLLLRAHMEAGTLIRRKLIDEIKKTDLSVLELRGEHVFNLPGEKNVSFTAYRVEFIVERKYQVPSSELKEVISLR
ncbi:hypothetical protein [Fictibacillus nanhaiensis]|uniref:hypothetical protein n=1 Tax=Fictibacillus nanhaiensis TaxID=742169 RepID=UPI003C1EDE59